MRKRQLPIRPLLRLLFVLLMFGSAFVFVMFQGDAVSWTIFYVLIPFVAYSFFIYLYPMKNFTIKRFIHQTVIERDESVKVTITLQRKTRFPLLYVVMCEKWKKKKVSAFVGSTSRRFLLLGFKKQFEWSYEVKYLPRGEYELLGCDIELYDFFGWICKQRTIPLQSTFLVLPKMRQLDFIALSNEFEQGDVVSTSKLLQDTTLVTGVREYQPGDRFSWINWKAFAKTESLMTKEFENRQTQELTVLFDSRPSSLFEQQVEFTASLINKVSTFQSSVSFAVASNDPVVIPAIRTKEQLRQAFVELAKVQPLKDEAHFRLPEQQELFQQGKNILVITSRPDWSLLERICRQALQPQAIHCFVLHRKGTQVEEQIQFAKSKGIAIHVVGERHFHERFNEVANL